MERHLSRQITIATGGPEQVHHLSVLTIMRDTTGCVAAYGIEAFTAESEGVTYHESPLRLERDGAGNIALTEVGRT